MKKIISILGSLIAIVAIFIGLVDETLGLWQCIIEDNVITYYFNAFGQLARNGNVESIEKNVIMIIISAAVLIGATMTLIGGFTEKGGLAILGSLVIVAGISYFIYSLPNFQELTDILFFTDKNLYFGSEEIISVDYQWRLGNGFIILFFGSLITLIGSLLKDD